MNINEQYPSKYLKAADISDAVQVVISNIMIDEVGDDRKPIIFFNGFDKGMVLNKTNSGNISGLYGYETDNWMGKTMILQTAMVDFQGRSTPALRLYPPQQQQAQQAPMQQTAPMQPQPGQQQQPTGQNELNPPPANSSLYLRG